MKLSFMESGAVWGWEEERMCIYKSGFVEAGDNLRPMYRRPGHAVVAQVLLLSSLIIVQNGLAQKLNSLPESGAGVSSSIQAIDDANGSVSNADASKQIASKQASSVNNLMLPSLSAQQKFAFATENAFGLPSVVFAAAGAGVNQAQKMYPEFHQGAAGYGRYYWHSYADQAVDSYFVNYFLPIALHEDPRYHPLHAGGVWRRTQYAFSRLLITHTDSGGRTLNTSQILGSGMAASISALYYPERDRTGSIIAQRWLGNMAGDGLLMFLREFSPDITRAMKSFPSALHLSADSRRQGISPDR